MKPRRLLLALCFSLLCSGLVTVQLSRHLSPRTTRERPSATRQVVVAATKIHQGDVLSGASLRVVSVPASQAFTGAFQSTGELAGRTVQVTIGAGELVLAHDLAPVDAGTGLAVAIPPGSRAVSVHFLETSGSSLALISPGSHVDLFVTYRSTADDTFVSSAVLQDVRVLAVGQSKDVSKDVTPEDKSRSDGSITLLLSPDQVARLMAASSLGKITVALRNGTDRTTIAGLLRIKSEGDAGGQSKQPREESPRKRVSASKQAPATNYTVETLAGGKTTVQTFQGEK